MKKQYKLQLLIAIGAIFCMSSNNVMASCDCIPPQQGPQGVTGNTNFLNTFGSYFTLDNTNVRINQIPIDLVNSNVEMFNISPYEVHIVESGTYFVQYGVSHYGPGFFDFSASVAVFNNGSPIEGTFNFLEQFAPVISSLGFMVELNQYDVLTIMGTGVNLQQEANIPVVSAYLTAIKLSP